MRFDVSELKTANECGRKWMYSSRNAMHLRPKVQNDNLFFGSLFHECLHALYLGGNPDKIVEQAVRECQGDITMQKVITAMIRGYATEVLPDDLERYRVIDIEHSVHFTTSVIDPKDGKPIEVCGSIDMVCIEKVTNLVWGFEHKTCSKFRPDIYIMLDEQPRTYDIELQKFADALNKEYEMKFHEPGPYKVGGIFINEVKKVQRKFEYKRSKCCYSSIERENFKKKLDRMAAHLLEMREGNDGLCECSPGYLKCQMCDYASLCLTYRDMEVDLPELLEEFAEEYEVRECDHLDEKVERRIEG